MNPRRNYLVQKEQLGVVFFQRYGFIRHGMVSERFVKSGRIDSNIDNYWTKKIFY